LVERNPPKRDIFDEIAETNNIPSPPEGFVLDQPNNPPNVQSEKPRSFVLSKEVFEDAIRQHETLEQEELVRQKLIDAQDLFYQEQLRQQQLAELHKQEQQQYQYPSIFLSPPQAIHRPSWISNTASGLADKQIQETTNYNDLSGNTPKWGIIDKNENNNPPAIYIKRGVGAQRIGDTTIYDDGSTAHQIGGTTIFDDGSTAQQIGGTTIFDDGHTAKQIGQTTIYDDGSTSQQIGSTVIFDDGGTADIIGHSVLSDE
jgi:hypothetical protein